MKRTEIKTITRTEYHELVGLMALAKRYEELLAEIEAAAAKITGEDPAVAGGSLTADTVYDDQDADRLLQSLEIAVEVPQDSVAVSAAKRAAERNAGALHRLAEHDGGDS